MSGDAQRLARRYLSKCPPALSGQGGHNQTFKVACVLVHGFMLKRDEALALMREYNQRCQPAWSEKELAHKIDDAIKANSSRAPGYMRDEVGRHPIERGFRVRRYHYPPIGVLKEIRTSRTSSLNP